MYFKCTAKCKCKCKKKKKRMEGNSNLYFYYAFPTYEQIQTYLRQLAETYPGSIQVETIGYTYQGRQLDMIIIRKNLNILRNSVLIDGGIHAREWIAVTSVLYIINRIVKNPQLLDLMDFYIIPVLNPDGYIYTHTFNRLWRKNLNRNFSQLVADWGVDLNRNFPFGFGQAGSRSRKRSINYRGVCALSEKETQALANVMKKYEDSIKLYVSFHAFGNSIMYPWGYTRRDVYDRDILHRCAIVAKNAMSACKNRQYRVGSVSKTLYLASGCSVDFAKGSGGIKFCFMIELEKYGKSGFTPPITSIVNIGRECVEGVAAMIKFVHNYYNTSYDVNK